MSNITGILKYTGQLKANNRDKYVGKIFPTYSFGDIIILDYQGYDDVKIKFLNTGHEQMVSMHEVTCGYVRDIALYNMQKTVYGVGYIGFGKCSATNNKDAYNCWRDVLRRCYEQSFQQKHKCYIGCYVVEDWKCFQNFATWFYANKRCDKPTIDKDILCKWNLEYSPAKCSLVPRAINVLFAHRQRHGECPIGVRKIKNTVSRPYRTQLRIENEITCIGYYPTELEAFNAYKRVKEATIKRMANKYRNQLMERTYNAMLNYKVEITD